MTSSQKFEWEAREYEHREKSADWFWALGIMAIAAAATAVILENILFAIVIVIGAFVLTIYAARPPQQVRFVIDERGILAGNKRFPYENLESFWVDIADDPDQIPMLRATSNSLLTPTITIPLESVDPEAVRAYLKQYLREEEHIEPLSERIMDLLGF